MPSAHRLYALACASAALVSCSRELSLPPPVADTGYLSGRAIAEIAGTDQGEPVQGAIASVPGTNLHAETDAQGLFVLGPLPAGTYRVLLTQRTPGAEQRQRLLGGVTLTRGATKAIGDVSLHRNAQITGRALLDGNARGNAGVLVFVPGTEFATTTGDSGVYQLRGIPEGTLRVAALRQGFTPATTADMSAQGGVLTTAVDLVLPVNKAEPQSGAISGRVTVLGGGAVSISAFSRGNRLAVATASAAADGSFTLTALPQDLYRLHAEAPGVPSVDVPNLLVTSGTAIHLPDPLILAPLGIGNQPFDGGPPADTTDAGTDAGQGGSPDGGADAGHPQCGSDADCPGGQLCQDSICVACARDSDCQSGFVCRQSACTRQCSQNLDCPAGEVCSGGTCGACVTSSDCRDPALVCLPGGSCGACRSGLDCPSGKACLATGCGACTADAQCGAGHLCESGLCVAGQCHDNSGCPATQTCQNRQCTACTADAQCSAGHLCLGSQCQPGNCRTKADCASADACLNNICGACASTANCGAGQVCDPQQHACVAGNCNVSADCPVAGQVCSSHTCSACGTGVACPAGSVCSLGLCTPGNCLSPTDCPAAGEVCQNHSCGPCGKSADCGQSGLVCVSGACIAGQCVADGDCAPGQLCNSGHQCVGCSANSQCNQGSNSGRVCAAGLCQTGTCAQPSDCQTNGVYNGKACVGLNCAACTADAQCPAGRLCLGGSCTLATCRTKLDCPAAQACVNNQCGACSSTADCAGTGVCDPALRQCVPGNCNFDNDCTALGFAGEVCVSKTCTPCGGSVACAAGKVCASGACVAGNCTPQTGCPNGQICSSNNCVACAKNADCGASNLVCVAGACTPGNCAVASDCPTAGQLCSAAHQCSACTADAQCPGGTTSPPSGLCVLGLCKTGNCHVNADCAAINGGFCSANSCIPCAQNTDCGASGFVCTAGTCAPGNCAQESDCPSGQLCSASHYCVACTGNAQCGQNRVCSAGLCKPGNCATTADCAASFPGEVCNPLNLTCSLCTADSQCAVGNICISGKCTAGNCHSAADCAGGKQLCNTTSHQCYGCDSTTLTGGCPAGNVCDVNGFCQAGNCKQASDCVSGGVYSGQICQGYSCGPCSAQTQAQCAPGYQLCAGSQCVSGNCVTSADCTTATQPFCDQAQHLCKACATSAQCGAPSSGKVCNTATGACVAGTCAGDLACSGVGQTCNLATFSCQQAAPSVLAQGTVENTSVSYSQDAMALSGASNLYYDAPIINLGLTAVALDPVTLQQRWRVTDSASNSVTQNPGIVLPAPGFKGNELFVTLDGRGGGGNIIAHQAGDGSVAWTVQGDQQMCAGLAGTPPLAMPTLAWHEGNVAHLLRVDGTNARAITIGSNNARVGCAFGTRNVYYLVQDGLVLVDPVSNSFTKLPFTALPGNQYLGNTGPSVLAIYRPPGATQDVVVFGGNAITSSPGTPALYAVAVPDSGSPSFLFGTAYSVPVDGGTSPLIDAAGNIFVLSNSAGYLSEVNQAGTLLGQAANPFDKSQVMLAADGSCGAGITDCIIGMSGGNLKAVYFSGTATPKNQLTTAFTLSLAPQGGTFPLLSWPSIIAAPSGSASGALALWAQGSSAAQPALWSFSPATPRASGFSQAPPAWPTLAGDAGYHWKAPAYGCQKDADCAAPSSCIFNQCVGSCQTPAACTPGSPNCSGGVCSAGLGCVLGQCAACSGDASCGAGSRCSGGTCYVAPATGACSTSADCSAGQVCLRASCVAKPASALTLTVPASSGTGNGNFYTGYYSTYSGTTVGTDGTTYLVSASSGASQLTVLDGSGTVLLQKGLGLNYNVYTPPIAPVVRLGAAGAPDTLFFAPDSTNKILAITGTTNGASVAGTGTVVTNTIPFAAQGPLSFGYSKALDGATSRPTGFFYSNGNMIGVDLQNAAAGTTPLQVWSGVTSSSDPNPQAPNLVGSDGVVYHVRTTGIIEAWSPDGDLTGPAPTAGAPRSGKLLWTYPSSGNLGWNATYIGMALAHNDLGGTLPSKSDVLYICSGTAGGALFNLIPLSAAGASKPVVVTGTGCNHQPILVDTAGYAYFGTTAGLSVVSPQGAVSAAMGFSNDGVYAPDMILGDDNLVYLMPHTSPTITAVAVSPQHTLSVPWQLNTANNGLFDSYTFLTLVPGASGGLGHMLADWPSATTGTRNLSLYPLSTAHGLAPGWTTLGGDNRRRFSLSAP